jgi:hypothetical protein
MDHIRHGMPDSGLELDKFLREYHRFRHNLHVVDEVLCYRDWIMVPTALRTKVFMPPTKEFRVWLESTQTSSRRRVAACPAYAMSTHRNPKVKVDGSRRLTLKNRRFVCELDPRKTSLEDRRHTTSTTPPQIRKDEAIRSDLALMEPAITYDAHTSQPAQHMSSTTKRLHQLRTL